ncbi:pre-mRNA-splicing factor SLU7-like [Amphibalanus amphitrite]|uniref:pre-mRNA-splicing factor SLU7-like n=1 Tax=Amphibalanus amphitrite TaxID=1232801 RepID=UPI001C912338|nr:pre-mRNA-splicing factor SLU7-like [Amphibalanus amphitrite]XP_043196910.1 pre-mRNA-splicing factor SLU7-like [Amphibalanus amphitrite]
MAQSSTAPVSAIIRNKDQGDGGEPKKKTREEWKQAKELEEARKLGTVPAAVDEEGKDINPHIPQYISAAPWYFGQTGPTLKHQRPQPEKQKEFSRLDEWYKRGVDTSRVATKFRKGACENCGAMTHKRKDCLERPRKTGAKYTGTSIAADEHAQPNLALDFDGKRDRWNGYDPSDHSQILEEHRKIEEAKRQLKANKLKAGVTGEELAEYDDGGASSEDDEKYAEGVDMPGTKVDSKQRITVRNLRIREDTAKYLRNLALDSAYYDPKTRSMRENPYEATGKQDVDYQGENFVRFTGDTTKHAASQMFAWDAHAGGVDVHALAEPTKLEQLEREFRKKRSELKGAARGGLLEKYGGEEHLDAPPRELLLAQTEHYVEYSRQGKIVKGAEKEVVRSQYEEDVYINNHTTVWGSYWRDGHWGYKCCYSLIKNSYCTGEAGRAVNATDMLTLPPATRPDGEGEGEEGAGEGGSGAGTAGALEQAADTDSGAEERQRRKTLMEEHEERMAKKREKKRKKKSKKQKKKRRKKDSSSSSSDSESEEDEEEVKKRKIQEALMRQELADAAADRLLAMDERRRPYNSFGDVREPTAEEMEAWRMRQLRSDDPLAAFSTKR